MRIPPRRDDEFTLLEVIVYVIIGAIVLVTMVNLSIGWPG